jgi:hypothetical protein
VWSIFLFGAPKVIAPPMSIKARIGWAQMNKL